MIIDKEEYNREPVFYCKRCGSLAIKYTEGEIVVDYCNDCKGTDIGITRIDTWDKLYNKENK